MTVPARFAVCACLISAGAVAACGYSFSPSSTSEGSGAINGAPSGAVITGTASATLMLLGVKAGDRIDIKVGVTDTSVRIDAENRQSDRDDGDDGDDDDDEDDDDNDDVELTGTVSNLTGTCPTLTFTMNGTTVRTNSATDFDVTCGQIANGTRIEVEGARQFDGSLLATEVERDDD